MHPKTHTHGCSIHHYSYRNLSDTVHRITSNSKNTCISCIYFFHNKKWSSMQVAHIFRTKLRFHIKSSCLRLFCIIRICIVIFLKFCINMASTEVDACELFITYTFLLILQFELDDHG